MQTHVPLRFLRRYIYGCSGCIIGSKTLLAERGKLPLKLTCPAGTYTCPATRLNKGYTSRTLPKTLLAERGKLGSCSAWPIAVFAKFSCNRVSDYVAFWCYRKCPPKTLWMPILNDICIKALTKMDYQAPYSQFIHLPLRKTKCSVTCLITREWYMKSAQILPFNIPWFVHIAGQPNGKMSSWFQQIYQTTGPRRSLSCPKAFNVYLRVLSPHYVCKSLLKWNYMHTSYST